MWFLGKTVVLSFWLAFCRHPDSCTKGSQMECTAMPWHLSLNALMFVSWVSINLNVKPWLQKIVLRLLLSALPIFLQQSYDDPKKFYSLSRNLDCSTAKPFVKKNRNKKYNKRHLMIDILLKTYAMNKNVTAELFLEIIDNWPFLIQQQNYGKANKFFSLGEFYWCLSALPWWLNLQVVTYLTGATI